MHTLNEDQSVAKEQAIAWYKNKTPGRELACLEGFAGTGKTFLTKDIIKELNINNPLVSAPTNKAKNVIETMTGFKGQTVHQILGLRMDIDLKDFDPRNPAFNPKNPPNIDYPLVVIDEASMINSKLYEEIKKLAERKKVKVLFMGDRYQLPPVKEKVSKVFTDTQDKFVLNKVVRQGENNPNSELIEIAINDIINRTENLNNFIRNNSSKTITPSNLNESKGFVYLEHNSLRKPFFEADVHNFLDNKSKYMAFTNQNVQGTLEGFRSNILNIDDYINRQDSLVGYKTISIKKGRFSTNIITNSEEYNILELTPANLDEGMKGFRLRIENIYTKGASYINLVDLSDPYTKQIFTQTVHQLLSKAKAFGKQNWRKYFEFVDRNLTLEDVFHPNGNFLLEKKKLYYSYGYTVHKSQGSTFTNSFVNITNIDRVCYDKEVAKRLKYVALSRCTNVNIIM